LIFIETNAKSWGRAIYSPVIQKHMFGPYIAVSSVYLLFTTCCIQLWDISLYTSEIEAEKPFEESCCIFLGILVFTCLFPAQFNIGVHGCAQMFGRIMKLREMCRSPHANVASIKVYAFGSRRTLYI
jgi:hypothetical protein